VRYQNDDGWAAPGCVMLRLDDGRLRIFWPDENVFTVEVPDRLVLYGAGSASQPLVA
jgi:hypothetical protein